MRCRPIHVSHNPRYALERDVGTGAPMFSIPVSNSLVDYQEWYAISEEELRRFLVDPEAARAFAGRCGRREMDDRRILKPGTDRGSYSG